MGTRREAAVAGQFYSSDPEELRAQIQAWLEEGIPPPTAPKALIVPHAGYAYSGAVAGHAVRELLPARSRRHRVVLLGPAHRMAFRGLALPSVDCFGSPLGDVSIDGTTVRRLLELEQVQVLDAAHTGEHCLEVQLPLLQVALPDFSIVPLVVGDAAPDLVAEVLEHVWDDEDVTVLVSSDLSHYLDYESAMRRDAETARRIESLGLEELGPEDACGYGPVRGLLYVARSRGLRLVPLERCNSGDTAGPRDRVVGYGAWSVR